MMGKYCITMERTLRIAKWFEAENDEIARGLADKIHMETKDSEYEGGDAEYDYALCHEGGCTVVDWNN